MQHRSLTTAVLAIAWLPWLPATAEPPVIDDAAISLALREQLAAVLDDGKGISGETLAKAAEEAPRTVDIGLTADVTGEKSRYEDQVNSIFVLGSIYNCGKCQQWHNGGGATAWALTADGIMVTNHHVFEKASGDSWGVCSFEGKVYPVTEVLASNPSADLAIFRVDTGGAVLRALPLADPAPVGSRVSLISHPEGRNFFQTSGEVARYVKVSGNDDQDSQTWMSVTADYAKGSSGGPILNEAGAVVGIAAVTQSIYYGSSHGEEPQGPLQMVVKNCIPVASLKAMIVNSPPTPHEN